jgi:hypothetical protein
MSTINKTERSIPILETKNDNEFTLAFENGKATKIALESYFTSYKLDNGILYLEGKILNENIFQTFDVIVKKFNTKPQSDEWNEGYMRLEYNDVWYIVDIAVESKENLKSAINFPYYNYLPHSIYAQIVGSITTDL